MNVKMPTVVGISTFMSRKNSILGLFEPGKNAESLDTFILIIPLQKPGQVAQSVGHLTRMSEVLGLILGLATYFRFSFH